MEVLAGNLELKNGNRGLKAGILMHIYTFFLHIMLRKEYFQLLTYGVFLNLGRKLQGTIIYSIRII
jgi:hypothetical protein